MFMSKKGFLIQLTTVVSVLTSVSFMVTLVGCNNSKQNSLKDYLPKNIFSASEVSRLGIDPKPEHRALADMKKSFYLNSDSLSKKNLLNNETIETTTQPLVQLKSDQIWIQKQALEKEFLLSANLITQSPTPMFNNLQSRVVYFIKRGTQLLMLEGSQGRSVGGSVNPEPKFLIASFEIKKTSVDGFLIDFNDGMKKIITAGDTFSSDDMAPGSGFEYNLPIAQLQASYIDQIKLTANSLQISQVAQVLNTDAASGASKIQSVQINYILAPYSPEADFEPVVSVGISKQGLNQVGFFEANPLILEDGSTRIYSMKWNEKKPIVFAISANTPVEYRELVKSGVLYWNKILGENKVQVIQLDDKSITAPNDQYNIIQWANWDAAGYAYADAQLDPRSGQILHAQVFFPTAFINANVERRVRTMESANEETATEKKKFAVGLSGFKSAKFCNRNINKELFRGLMNAMSENVSAEAMDKAMRDYVFEVIAHEVGHLMGLRHNFAGNLYSNYDASDRSKLALDYYKNKKAPEGIRMTSSVMEYSRFEESAWDGDILQRSDSLPLPYDNMALRFLYFKESVPSNSVPFCTDSEINKYVDCNMSDAGQSVISYAKDNYRFNIKTLPMKILNLYIAKTKIPDEKNTVLQAVKDVDLNAKAIAKSIAEDYFKLISSFKANSQFVKVSSDFVSQGRSLHSTDQEELNLKNSEYVQNEIQRLGGLKSVLADGLLSEINSVLELNLASVLNLSFENILANSRYNSGESFGQKYSFTVDEKQIMKTEFSKFAVQLQNELVQLILSALSGETISLEGSYGQSKPAENPIWKNLSVMDDYSSLLLEKALYYAFSSNQKMTFTVKQKTGFQKNIELPIYKFDQKTRLSAVGLFATKSEAIEWAFFEKKQLQDAAQESLDILGNLDDIDLSKYSKSEIQPILKWVLQAQEVKESVK